MEMRWASSCRGLLVQWGGHQVGVERASLQVGEDRCGLLAGVHAELREYRSEVALDGAFRQVQVLGDLGIGETLSDQGDHLVLTMGEGGTLDAGADLAWHDRLAARHRMQRGCK